VFQSLTYQGLYPGGDYDYELFMCKDYKVRVENFTVLGNRASKYYPINKQFKTLVSYKNIPRKVVREDIPDGNYDFNKK